MKNGSKGDVAGRPQNTATARRRIGVPLPPPPPPQSPTRFPNLKRNENKPRVPSQPLGFQDLRLSLGRKKQRKRNNSAPKDGPVPRPLTWGVQKP